MFDYFFKNNPYDCEVIVIDKEFTNIVECNSYFEFYQTKILSNKNFTIENNFILYLNLPYFVMIDF